MKKISIVEVPESHKTESVLKALQELTQGKLRNTLSYLPRLGIEETLGIIGNTIKGKEQYRLTTQLGGLIKKGGEELSFLFKRQKEPPKLKVVHHENTNQEEAGIASGNNNHKIAA